MVFGDLSDEEWLATLVRSVDDASLGLPGFPPAQVQATFVGQSGEAAIRPAFALYRLVAAAMGARRHTADILDFGVGWGRVLRTFLRDTTPDHLFGVDVDPAILDVCRQTGMPGTLLQIDPHGSLPFADSRFGCCFAYSVFSHLSEASAAHWLRELIRVTEPGGTILVTTMDLHLLDLCIACRRKTGRTEYEEQMATLFADPEASRAEYLAGRHVYAPVGGGIPVLSADFYGWAAIPRAWIGDHFPTELRLDLFDRPPLVEQTVIGLTVTKPPG